MPKWCGKGIPVKISTGAVGEKGGSRGHIPNNKRLEPMTLAMNTQHFISAQTIRLRAQTELKTTSGGAKHFSSRQNQGTPATKLVADPVK